MTQQVQWQGDNLFEGTSNGGHKVTMEALSGDGSGSGPSPMEMLILGLGGCTCYDVVHILKKMRIDVDGCRVELDATRADDDPKVYTKIHIVFFVKGKDLDPAKVERAVALSAEKYCSASIMLGKTAEITHEVRLED